MTPRDFDKAITQAYREGLREGAIFAFTTSAILFFLSILSFCNG